MEVSTRYILLFLALAMSICSASSATEPTLGELRSTAKNAICNRHVSYKKARVKRVGDVLVYYPPTVGWTPVSNDPANIPQLTMLYVALIRSEYGCGLNRGFWEPLCAKAEKSISKQLHLISSANANSIKPPAARPGVKQRPAPESPPPPPPDTSAQSKHDPLEDELWEIHSHVLRQFQEAVAAYADRKKLKFEVGGGAAAYAIMLQTASPNRTLLMMDALTWFKLQSRGVNPEALMVTRGTGKGSLDSLTGIYVYMIKFGNRRLAGPSLVDFTQGGLWTFFDSGAVRHQLLR